MLFDLTMFTPQHWLLLLAAFVIAFIGIFVQVKFQQGRVARVGLALSAIITALTIFFLPNNQLSLGLLIATVLIMIIGTRDETKSIPAPLQFVFQIIIAGILIFFGWHIGFISNPFGQGILYLTPYLIPIASFIWILLIMNAVNWIDGIDGLAAGTSLSAFIILALISLLPAIQDQTSLSLALIGAGTMAAFFIWNMLPARAYLGTTGSWFLGLYLAILAMIGSGKIAITLIVLAIPVIDALIVIVTRLAKGQKPWQKDTTSHIHYRLQKAGLKPVAITTLLTIVSLVLGAAAIAISHQTQDCQNFYQAKLQTSTTVLNLNLAQTPVQQSQGLGGCKTVPQNAGMYFPFPSGSQPAFWMKDMLIPIDIVWLNKGQVVSVDRKVPAPPNPQTPDKELPQYPAPGPVDAVLEIKSGQAQAYGLQIGS